MSTKIFIAVGVIRALHSGPAGTAHWFRAPYPTPGRGRRVHPTTPPPQRPEIIQDIQQVKQSRKLPINTQLFPKNELICTDYPYDSNLTVRHKPHPLHNRGTILSSQTPGGRRTEPPATWAKLKSYLSQVLLQKSLPALIIRS